MKLLLLGVVSLLLSMATTSGLTPSGNENRANNERIQDRFTGAWRLAWLEEQGADGQARRVDCTGMLVYTRDGHMSVQVMYRSPEAGTNVAPLQYAQGG